MDELLAAAVESSTPEVKRRGSPSSLASEEPNPKRTQACADSSLITQLVNDKFIKDLACLLAVDEKIVGMAGKLLEGVKSEHGSLDLDAWKYITSLPIWWTDKLLQYPTMMRPKQEHLKQQLACISDDLSLEPLFAAKEHVRVVLILVILSGDVPPTRAKKTPVFDEMDEMEREMAEMPCCYFDIPFDDDHVCMISPSKDEKKVVEKLADKVKNESKIVEVLHELLLAVLDPSPLGAPRHFDKVKEVWENQTFVDHLLEFEYRPRSREIAELRLSQKIRTLIRNHPLFDSILGFDDPAFRTRVALFILIGFWSNRSMILPLVCTMGGDEPSGEGEEEITRDWMKNPPNVLEFCCDKSLGELVDQLIEEPNAVKLANVYLETLELGDCHCSEEEHVGAAGLFWHQPSVILKLRDAMQKNPNSVKVLTKYSKGAEALRQQERMSHLRKDLKLELQRQEYDSDDSKTRLALNILFGYWVDEDVTLLFRSLWDVQKRIGKFFNKSEDGEIVAFHYYARSATDVEGLESWLAKIYGKRSVEAMHLANKIGDYQKKKGEEAKERGYSDGPICIQLVLNASSILSFTLCWFDSSIFANQFVLFAGERIQLC